MEILILLVALIAASLWVKHQYPQSQAAKIIENWLNFGLALSKKANPPIDVITENQGNAIETPSNTVDTSIKQPKPIAAINPIPEDSVLKRHYLNHIEAERQAIANPYPTDSVLRRHHESRFSGFSKKAISSIQAIVIPATESPSKLKAPQDAVLRRHFLTQLRADIESTLHPRPTDSTLIRHYEAHIQSELNARLIEAIEVG